MSIGKTAFRFVVRRLRSIPNRLIIAKTFLVEWSAIIRKRHVYKGIKWSDEQKREFKDFWKTNYGKRISSRWHKLYQACSGSFCVRYMPDLIYATRIEPKLADYNYSEVLEDKSLIEILGMNCGCVVPRTITVCSGGVFYDGSRAVMTEAEAVETAAGERDMIVKPTIGSSSGQGLLVLKSADAETIKGVFKAYGKDFIIQSLIVPSGEFAALNPSSINTVRITTYISGGRVHHFPICLRIGRAGKSVDNIHSGGVCVGVSEDGTLSKYGYILGYSDTTTRCTEHPDSRIRFEGYRVPGIKDLLSVSKRLHGRFPHIGIISWDLAVNKNNEPVLIEANIRGQSIWICQMIHGEGAFGEQTEAVLKLIR